MNKKRCSFEHREVGAREGLKIGADADRGHERPKIKRRIESLVFCSERTTWTCAMNTAQVFVWYPQGSLLMWGCNLGYAQDVLLSICPITNPVKPPTNVLLPLRLS